ncbi:MAG: TetR/AcrR family transcriptional regulator [Candidatus Altiarchaeota archaeon]
MPKNNDKPSLRERKQAQTKLTLLKIAIEKLKEKPLDHISVKEICDEVPVSEVTFYNYYPTKQDLLIFYLKLWSVEIIHNLKNKCGKDSGLQAIETFFTYNAKRMQENPILVKEIIVKISGGEEPPCFGSLTQAELEYAFPNEKGIKDESFREISDIFQPYLKNAVKKGELPKETNQELVLNVLSTMFLGLLLTFPVAKGKNLSTLYKKHLSLLWAGLKAQ